MDHHCEVCETMPRSIDPARPVVQVKLDKRAVTLCRGHARIAVNSGVTDFDSLRELYGSGRRSYLPRRDPLAHPQAGEERQNSGRRAYDR